MRSLTEKLEESRREGQKERAHLDLELERIKAALNPDVGEHDEQALVCLLIEIFSTRAEEGHFIATWRIIIYFELCWPKLFSHLAAFDYHGLWFLSLRVSG